MKEKYIIDISKRDIELLGNGLPMSPCCKCSINKTFDCQLNGKKCAEFQNYCEQLEELENAGLLEIIIQLHECDIAKKELNEKIENYNQKIEELPIFIREIMPIIDRVSK